MGGVQLALRRWLRDPAYQRIFHGDVLDIGGAGDPFALVASQFPAVTSVTTVDHDQAPAPWVPAELNLWAPDAVYDIVFSSHTLEHLVNPFAAVSRWQTAVKPGGYLVLIVPAWELYERCTWPSIRNTDHRTAWTLTPPTPDGRPIFSFLHLTDWPLVRAITLDDGFDPTSPHDQTSAGLCECGLEAVWRRPEKRHAGTEA